MKKDKQPSKAEKPKGQRPIGKAEKSTAKPDAKELNSVKHSFVAAGTTFTVPKRYEYIKVIGQGAYGVVCSAMDKLKNRKVAIKKVPNAFADLIDAKRIVREIKLLNFYNHENIVALLDVLKPESRTGFDDIYFVTDLMETDLHRVIYSQQDLTDDHVQYFMYQMLRGVLFIHSSSVIHRDLKPSNLLLNKNCDLKICDFGLARALVAGNPEGILTEYVVTRWYRAPEVILNASNYTKELDIWSVGCIMAELLGRTPLFPGNSFIKLYRSGLP
jgi:mitogen-activated protein kinase 1/3